MVTSLPGSSIVSSSGRAALLDTFRKQIASRLTFCETAAALELLQSLKAQLSAEKESAGAANAEFIRLTAALDSVTAVAEITPLCEQFKALCATQFANRPSSATLYGISLIFYDKVLSRLLAIAAEGSGMSGVIAISGELGRRESLCARRSSILFIYPDASGNEDSPAKKAASELEQSLAVIFPFISTVPGKGSSWFWSGSLSEWRGLITGALFSGYSESNRDFFGFAGSFATIADARVVCGNMPLAEQLNELHSTMLAETLSGEHFKDFARDISELPVALGIFGRLKTVKNGRQRGRLPLADQAIKPLVNTVRTFAAIYAIRETSTDGRVKALLSLGAIGVALGEKLVAAWQLLTREMVRIELADCAADELFLDMNAVDEETKEQLKAALDELTTLQRHLYQQISEESSR